MTQMFVELLILIPSTLFSGYVLFVTTVLQMVMYALDEASFKRFVSLLVKMAPKSMYVYLSSSTTLVTMIPYFIFYRFTHWWFIAGLLFYVLASISGKVLNFPIYDRIAALASSDVAALSQVHRKVQTANRVRSLRCMVSIGLMVIQFA